MSKPYTHLSLEERAQMRVEPLPKVARKSASTLDIEIARDEVQAAEAQGISIIGRGFLVPESVTSQSRSG